MDKLILLIIEATQQNGNVQAHSEKGEIGYNITFVANFRNELGVSIFKRYCEEHAIKSELNPAYKFEVIFWIG